VPPVQVASLARMAGATIEQQAAGRGADLVLEGGGVKGIALVGAVTALTDAGYAFPRIGGTSAGAVVGALTAAYQQAGVPLGRLREDLADLDTRVLADQGALERLTGPVGRAAAVLLTAGAYRTDALARWLGDRLAAVGVRTFGDLRIDDDPGTSLPPKQRYRLVVHVSDLTRRCVVRVPWDLPQYLLPEGRAASDAYPVVDAVRASAALPYVFRPVRQPTPQGACTWVDGGLLAYFPVTVFDRTDGRPARWPTFGVRLESRPPAVAPDVPVGSVVGETLALLRTATGQWNRYALEDEGVANRTVFVDTTGVAATDFDLDAAARQRLFAEGQRSAGEFLAAWSARGSR
jgi:NTE family protein